jgi:arylsulfate sulfotransferase
MKKSVLPLIAALFLFGCHKDRKVVINKNGTTSFTIPANAVVLNPSGNAPLSALVTFTSAVSGHTEIVVKGKNGAESNVVQVFTDDGTSHSIPIVGLYAAYKNTVDVYVIDANKDSTKATLSITTGSLPANTPDYIHVDVADRAHMQPGMNLVSSFSGYPTTPMVPYMIDSFGDIRWCLDFSKNTTLSGLFYDCGINRLADGNFRFVDQSTEKIYEVDILGKIVNTWGLGGYTFHHDLYEKPNGNFLVTVNKPGSTHPNGVATTEDYIIEIDRASGNIVTTWDLKQSLNEYRQTIGTDATDWMHANGLVYDASDNTLIVSGRVQGVFKITYDNHVKWVLGPHRGWGPNHVGQDLNQLLLTPLDSKGVAITDTSVLNGWTNSPDFEWNWYQHSPQLIPNGDLMIFDNGTTRNYNNAASTYYSRAVEYKINDANLTVQQIWDYGKERGLETFSSIVSSVKYLDDDHVLFSPGYNVANSTGNGGKIVEVDYATHNVVFQMSISSQNTWGWHRVQRMPIYPNGNPYK